MTVTLSHNVTFSFDEGRNQNWTNGIKNLFIDKGFIKDTFF